jgi:outer membrane protein assembly factor BamB
MTKGSIYFSLFIGDGYFFALDAQTGQEQKTLKLKGVSISPLAVAGEYVFMGTSDGKIRSLDRKTGKPQWQIGRKDYRFDVTSPLVANGVLLLGGANSFTQQDMRPDGTVHAIDALTGKQIWMTRIKGIASSPAVHNGTVYFADEESQLFAIDLKTGQEKWRFKAQGDIRTHVVSGEYIYFADRRGDLYSVNTNSGRFVWKAARLVSVGTALALENGLIYYGGREGSIYAVDTTNGVSKWVFKTRGLCSAPVIAGGALCFVSSDKALYAVDATSGQQIWRYRCENELTLSPLITDDTIYLLDDDGYMHALR